MVSEMVAHLRLYTIFVWAVHYLDILFAIFDPLFWILEFELQNRNKRPKKHYYSDF